jgi:hypothetical protein
MLFYSYNACEVIYMQNGEPMCYITYAVPARLMPQLSLNELYAAENAPHVCVQEEPPELYPTGFVPEWFLRGSFPEDDFDD